MPAQFLNTVVSRAGLLPAVFPPEELPKIRRGWNCRVDLREIEKLAHEIAANPIGQHTPGAVRKGEGGYAYTIAGNRRLEAIRHINANLTEFQLYYPHIKGPLAFKAYLLNVNEDEAAEITLSENLDRMELSPIDKAHALRDLESRGWDNARIASALRCGTTYLPQLRSYLTLPEEARQKLHDGVLTGELATSLIGLPDAEIKETVARVSSGAVKPAQARREVNNHKRASGLKVRRTEKELRDELTPLAEEYMLASALLEYMAGNSTFSSLRELISAYDRCMRAE